MLARFAKGIFGSNTLKAHIPLGLLFGVSDIWPISSLVVGQNKPVPRTTTSYSGAISSILIVQGREKASERMACVYSASSSIETDRKARRGAKCGDGSNLTTAGDLSS